MTSAERRVREREKLRQAILDAARELFVTQDYTAVTMRRIAEKIEYSPTAIYLHFKNKEEIVLHLAGEGFALLGAWMEEIQHEDPCERLKKGSERYVQFALQHTQHFQIMFEVKSQALDDYLVQLKETGEGASGFIRKAVREAIEGGQLKCGDIEMVAHTLWATMHGIAELALAGRLSRLERERQEEFFRFAIDALLCGLCVEQKSSV